MDDVRLILCTFPDEAKARQIGTLAVENQHCACVNLLPGVESIYRWEGAVERAREVLAIFKTTAGAQPAMCQWLREAHPYDTPEIVTIAPVEVDARYRDWLVSSVAPPGR
jgi:periplasmic divalent cation tolerance protein